MFPDTIIRRVIRKNLRARLKSSKNLRWPQIYNKKKPKCIRLEESDKAKKKSSNVSIVNK